MALLVRPQGHEHLCWCNVKPFTDHWTARFATPRKGRALSCPATLLFRPRIALRDGGGHLFAHPILGLAEGLFTLYCIPVCPVPADHLLSSGHRTLHRCLDIARRVRFHAVADAAISTAAGGVSPRSPALHLEAMSRGVQQGLRGLVRIVWQQTISHPRQQHLHQAAHPSQRRAS